MIRRVQLSLDSGNTGKLIKLDMIAIEALRVLNALIDALWLQKSCNKYASIKIETWLSARFQQALLKQAAETVKSRRKKGFKNKPEVKRWTFNLDQRFISLNEDVNSFDLWIHLASIGDGITLDLPSKKHKHFLKFKKSGWTLRKGGRLRKVDGIWMFDLCFEKASPISKAKGKSIGIDIGYKKLLAVSDGRTLGSELQDIYTKISHKKQGSKAFKRALIERDQQINRTVNQLDLTDVSTVVVEALKNVKKNSSGKIRKSFNNKLQRWAYPKVLGKLQHICEESGISFKEVDPAYTSQTCSLCGHVDKASRKGEAYCCTQCGVEMDADINAAKNILMRGVYSPSSDQYHQIPF